MTFESKQAASKVAELLSSYAKGEADPAEVVKPQVMDLIFAGVPSLDQAIASYRFICDDFLAKVIAVKGMPTKVISEGSNGEIRSSSGKSIAADFEQLLPLLKRRHAWCIENYGAQAEICFRKYVSEIRGLIDGFFAKVPVTAKERTSNISKIKREIGYFARWQQLFYTHKAMSFASEVEYIFILSGEPIAAVWKYNPLDEQCEFPPTVDHRPRDGRVYAVRGNWAEAKGFMIAGPDGYIDDIDRPHQETGCMCHLHWLHGIRRLPEDMLTSKGRAALTARLTIPTMQQTSEKASAPAARKG
ncbi:hypothetical protein A4S02_14340 (plasmid) [Acetobacter ascendens]|uniref:Phage head morphogenesis domain-containing protein n=1 Tax=Acetobacter ascendens TaxID=481146 RepID=A0A1D8R097_9PROT|nr:hypothetical protein [Acetobacter ascendens]AOW48006.1 hypothetical protein A4S02_14340 [Acetobacter ascendens]